MFGKETNVCIDAKKHALRGDAQAAPANALIWGRYINRFDCDTAARLKRAGVTHITTHDECGMAKLYADTTHPDTRGRKVPQQVADAVAYEETRKFARKNDFAHTHIKKGDLCPNCDDSKTHIIRATSPTIKSRGFRINHTVTPLSHVAASIAHGVGTSRGALKRTDVIVAPTTREAKMFSKKLNEVNPATVKEILIQP